MTVGTIFVNRNGMIVSASGGIANYLGYSNEEIVHTQISKILHVPEESNKTHFQWLCDLPAGTELAGDHLTEGEMPIEVCPFRTQTDSELVGLACAPVKVDQTSLRHSRKVIAMFTHDLRTPLNSILGFVQLLEMGICGEISPKSLNSLKIAERNVLKVLKLVDELLNFEKLDSSHKCPSFDNVFLSDVVNQAIEAAEQSARAKDIVIETDIKNVTVKGDSEQLFRLVLNLVDNAVKFSPPKSTVSIKCESFGGNAKISVSDFGPGVSKEFHKAIFEPFFQVKPTNTLGHKGVGLGLSVCKAVLELHRGQIGLISEVGSGSNFWVQLPIKTDDSVIPLVIPMSVPACSAF